MKNKTNYHILFLLIIFFGVLSKTHAEVKFEFSPLYMQRNGCLNELVFNVYDDGPLKLSELNWNIDKIS